MWTCSYLSEVIRCLLYVYLISRTNMLQRPFIAYRQECCGSYSLTYLAEIWVLLQASRQEIAFQTPPNKKCAAVGRPAWNLLCVHFLLHFFRSKIRTTLHTILVLTHPFFLHLRSRFPVRADSSENRVEFKCDGSIFRLSGVSAEFETIPATRRGRHHTGPM